MLHPCHSPLKRLVSLRGALRACGLGALAQCFFSDWPRAPRRRTTVVVIEDNTSYSEVLGNRVDAPFINDADLVSDTPLVGVKRFVRLKVTRL